MPADLVSPAYDIGQLSAEDRRIAAVWHGAWALAVAAGTALVLVALGAVPGPLLWGLGLAALPGVAGFAYRPRRIAGRAWVLSAWAAAGGLAAALTGGVTGPLGVLCIAPLVAAIAYGGLWRAGASRAFAVLAAVAVVQAGGRAGLAPAGAAALAGSLVAYAATLALGAAALMLLAAGAQARPDAAGEPGPEADRPDPELLSRLEDAEAARAFAEADARGKMRFLATMSHELRTPLNAIMGFSDIMRSRLFGEMSPKYGEYAELIHESGRHLLDLINDVLDVSKIEADKYVLSREQFDAREAASAALRILRQQADDAGVQLRGLLPPEPIEVDADRRALKQIVLNLVANALKFTPAGGAVTVSFAAAGTALEIAVTDTGVGIAPEDLARLGRPYEQAGDAADRMRGTGLGLSLVKAFARLHGGDMVIESRLGEGTAVTVRLPVLEGAATPAS